MLIVVHQLYLQFHLLTLTMVLLLVKVGNCYSESQFITLGWCREPITTLAGNISKSGPSSGVYTYVVTSSGGIGGVFGVGTFTSTLATYTATLTDSVGCQITVTIIWIG
jgi:hypothetical protein